MGKGSYLSLEKTPAKIFSKEVVMTEKEELLKNEWRKAYQEVRGWEASILVRVVRLRHFLSSSKGQGRGRRKYPREIILLNFGGSIWHFVPSRDALDKHDQRVQEALEGVNLNGKNSLDYFWEEIEKEIRRRT